MSQSHTDLNREKSVESYLVSSLKAIGIPCLKFIPDNRVGMPDRLVLMPDGKVVWVEMKTDKGELSPVQKYRHRELQKSGQRVTTLWNKKQVDAFVSTIEKEKSLADC